MDTNSEVPAEQKAAVEERDASRDDGGRRDTSPDTNQDDGGLDRSMLDFDPADNYFTGTVVDGTTEIPGPHAFDQKDDKS